METILQHFRKDEQPFIETVIGWIREVEDTYSPKLTDFLDPRQRFIVESLTANSDLVFSSHGAFSEAERQRGLIYPDYYEPQLEDYQVSVFELNYATKFLTMTHPSVLGSLMSLGIDRSKYGDIRLEEEVVQFVVAEELKDYMIANFVSVGKAKITVQEITQSELFIQSTDTWEEEFHIVSSMRLDVVVATLLNCSRQRATQFIHGEKIRVNWTVREQPAFEIFELDILSIRGAGRYKVLAIEGRTRKNKIRLIIGKLV